MKTKEITVNISKKIGKVKTFGSDMCSASMTISIEDETEIKQAYLTAWNICHEEVKKQEEELKEASEIEETVEDSKAWLNGGVSESTCAVCKKPLTFKEGISKTGKPYKGYFCSEKGHPVQWVK